MQIMLHQVGISPVLLALRQFIEMDINYINKPTSSSSSSSVISVIMAQFSNVKLTAKEFIQVNRPLKPCLVGKEEAIKQSELCKIDCFEMALINITRCKCVDVSSFQGINN